MKPISNLKGFLERFDDFKNAELRSIDIVSATEIKIVFATQDRARDFDWLCIEFLFSGINDAKLIESAKYSLIDISEGITIFNENNKIGFSIGRYNKLSTIKDALFYIVSANIKYKETQF